MNRKSRISGWKLALSIILCGTLMLFITASAGDPVTFTLSGGSVTENAGAGVHVGDFQLTSADSNPVYSLAGGQGDNGSFNIDGASLYTAASFDYEDGSSYTVVVDVTADNEGVGQETFSVDVSNISPSASSFSITVDEDGSKSGTLPLSGDNTSVSFSVASDPGKGSADVNGSTGGYIYTPNANENGDDSFTYRVSDGNSSDTATVSVTITPVNDDPVISQGESASLSCQEDGTAQSITLDATDPDSDPLQWSIASQADHGTASADAGTISYTPEEKDYNGSDSFTISVSDGNGGSDSITVSVTIDPVNDPPTFTVGTADSVDEDCGDQSAPGLITAMSPGADNEEQTISFIVESNTNPGLFTAGPLVDGSGTLTFTPAGNASGEATITLSAQDSEGLSADGTQDFTITMNAVNDARLIRMRRSFREPRTTETRCRLQQAAGMTTRTARLLRRSITRINGNLPTLELDRGAISPAPRAQAIR